MLKLPPSLADVNLSRHAILPRRKGWRDETMRTTALGGGGGGGEGGLMLKLSLANK